MLPGRQEGYEPMPQSEKALKLVGDVHPNNSGCRETVYIDFEMEPIGIGKDSKNVYWPLMEKLLTVTGTGFIARGITFRNTAGAANHQAVAMRSGCDLSVFYQCSFEGYQDTLYVHSLRQFYRECDVYGTVDFIFGNSAVVLQNCNIYARLPMHGQQCTYTAQGRTDANQNTGISIYNSNLLATSDIGTTPVWLGRPWKQYSRTVYMQSYMGSQIMPAGWMEWAGNFALSTLYYGEYMNTGPGSSTANRVTWGGYRVITSPTEASVFTVGNFIAGGSWLPGTGVPFTSGL